MKVPGKLSICAGLLALFGATDAEAQADGGLLRGVQNLDPYVLPLDEDSATCGIDAAEVRKLLRQAATDAPFRLGESEHVLFVRLSSLPKQDDCFSSIDLGVYWEGDVALPGSSGIARAKVKLWENGTILISPRDQHWREVAGIIRHLIDNLRTDWQLDNNGAG